MSSFRQRFASLTVQQAIELNIAVECGGKKCLGEE